MLELNRCDETAKKTKDYSLQQVVAVDDTSTSSVSLHRRQVQKDVH